MFSYPLNNQRCLAVNFNCVGWCFGLLVGRPRQRRCWRTRLDFKP
jgi:hypothetical protein